MPFPEVAVRTTLAIFVALVAAVPNLAAAQSDSPTLDIYFIDTEGGQATLYVSPSGETMLVDTGNPGERDHTRLMEVLREAGVDRIDHLFLTHYHVDHYGGLEALAAAVPILNYYDHG
ncbi:MAG TPA: MBL fold metallo-hydrolase, partial [Longimicrobiales bacterium]|nr:MBL fold metallo-hydrolase [Longimicrobiales bacterium]